MLSVNWTGRVMSLNVLVVDGHAGIYEAHLRREFPDLVVHTAWPAAPSCPRISSHIDVLVAFGIAIDDDVLRRLDNLKWVQSLATGVDHFLRSPTLAPEALITSGRGIHGPMMREMVTFLMLCLTHNVLRQVQDQKAHVWERRLWTLLYGKTAVVVGIGVSGIAIGEALTAFGMKVIGVTRTPRDIPGFASVMHTDRLTEAVGRADFVINVLPANPENLDLFTAKVFAAMKPTGVLRQRRARRDGRRGGADRGPARQAHRRCRARRGPVAPAAARQPPVGHAQRGDHPADRRLRGGIRGLRDADPDRQHAAVPGRPAGRDAQRRAAPGTRPDSAGVRENG